MTSFGTLGNQSASVKDSSRTVKVNKVSSVIIDWKGSEINNSSHTSNRARISAVKILAQSIDL